MTKSHTNAVIDPTSSVLSKDGTTISYLSMGSGPSVMVIPGVLVLLARTVRAWKQTLFLAQPETLLRWHASTLEPCYFHERLLVFETLWRSRHIPARDISSL